MILKVYYNRNEINMLDIHKSGRNVFIDIYEYRVRRVRNDNKYMNKLRSMFQHTRDGLVMK